MSKPWNKINWQSANARLANKPFDDLFTYDKKPQPSIGLSNDELQAQFQRCEQWNDPEQWDWLALAYYQRGYLLNALHCFRRADACRVSVAVETEG
jgi:hypothetical protein